MCRPSPLAATLALALLLVAISAWGWDAPTDSAGPLTITIGAVPDVQALETPVPVRVTLTSKGAGELRGEVRLEVTDNWRVSAPNPQAFVLAAGGKAELGFSAIAGQGSYAAHYPIHAFATFGTGEAREEAHAVLVTEVAPVAVPGRGGRSAAPKHLLALQAPIAVLRAGALALDRLANWRVGIARAGEPLTQMTPGWTGNDPESGTHFALTTASRPDAKAGFVIHPPYRGGVGPMWVETRFALPDITPIRLSFATAIRDHTEKEPPSDGVEWRVYAAAEGDELKELFRRFSAAKRWEPAEVDLSAYAGKTITLRLWSGPGPHNNTTCDSGYWAEPTLNVGVAVLAEPAEEVAARRERAIERARAALRGESGRCQWLLASPAGRFGVAWVGGPRGLADGQLALATHDQAVVFEHLVVDINGQDLRDSRADLRLGEETAVWDATRRSATLTDTVEGSDRRKFTVGVSMGVEAGAFKIKFAMPGVVRDRRGEPRFTRLALGPTSVRARRVYAGFGNVIQNPGRFTLGQGGFGLSTRHVGMDFENGLSLVQAADVFPYRFIVDPDKRLYSLETGHDATLMLVPSARGAFAAARVYRDVAGFRPAGGVDKLKGRMCIDWWGGHNIAADIRRAGAYGLNHCVFLKHAWQRWGYDYRLPDIYPPSCDPQVWDAWVSACREAGMLYGVHDNYIDFYPDAAGFSYRQILFNGDGTPQRAWRYKKAGQEIQSYRWLPGAYTPWLERNLKLVKQGFAPTAYFIDVFSAIPLLDYYDQAGDFHTKLECARHWGECFDTVRRTLGDNAPQISEAGHDGLVGHLDGCQSDHYTAGMWHWSCADSERTPWHDMATHGSLILFAGGLGHRYAGGDPSAEWGSDDYLSNTVMGGRNPMCGGPCTRDTVMTYWLQHDICDALAHRSLEAHEFAGDDIHRQHTAFGGGAEVWVNRGTQPWEVRGHVLPRFGYLAIAGDVTSSVTAREGLSVGYATSPGVTFVDARPASLDTAGRAPVKTQVLGARHLGGGVVECEVEWQVLKPLPVGYVPFVHLCHPKVAEQGEKIALHASMDLAPGKLQQVGTHRCQVRFTIPADSWEGDYTLRYGLYTPTGGGGRLLPIAYLDESRVRGGVFSVTRAEGAIKSIEYRPERPGSEGPRLNAEGKPIDFGPIVTNGAFRLLHSGDEWRLLPLQGSFPFRAELRLGKLGAAGRRVVRVEGLSQDGKKASEEKYIQTGDTLALDLSAEAFSYRIVLAGGQ